EHPDVSAAAASFTPTDAPADALDCLQDQGRCPGISSSRKDNGMHESSLRYPGWRVVIACFTMTLFGFGFGFYGHSVYLADFTLRNGGDAPKLATSIVSAATTAYYLLSALLIMFVSDAITRFGPRLVATAGALMLALSLVLVSRVSSPADLFVAYLAMAPAFATLTNAAVANILGLWFF